MRRIMHDLKENKGSFLKEKVNKTNTLASG